MKTDINLKAYELYLRHIILEAFPSEYLKEHETDTFKVCVGISGDLVNVTSAYANIFCDYKTNFNEHISRSLAITSSIGRCVLETSSRLGLPEVPYGVLTGVRPIKIASECSKGLSAEDFVSLMKSKYLVSSEKSDLLYRCAKFDDIVKKSITSRNVSLYISIPFCPTRCNYCSFVSSSIEKKRALLPDYLTLLNSEIQMVAEIIKKYSLQVSSVYIGGGTPGVLNELETDMLLKVIMKSFVINSLKEFTYEIGRPDTVTSEKLRILKNYGVTRVCINTQTTNDNVLCTIGRTHTATEYFNAVEKAMNYSFDSINTDLIAGLTGDDSASFENSLKEVIGTGVNNVTVHTLSLKKSSQLKTDSLGTGFIGEIDKAITFSKNYCISNGFQPYYLYRQKYSLGNHESVGYCKDGNFSHYNIAMMNEAESVIGIGAGATSRILADSVGEKHVHLANCKYPQDYLKNHNKISEQILKLDKIFYTKFTGVSE